MPDPAAREAGYWTPPEEIVSALTYLEETSIKGASSEATK